MDFLSGSGQYDVFLGKKFMKKYIGLLNGKNLERNLEFVLELLNQDSHRGFA